MYNYLQCTLPYEAEEDAGSKQAKRLRIRGIVNQDLREYATH